MANLLARHQNSEIAIDTCGEITRPSSILGNYNSYWSIWRNDSAGIKILTCKENSIKQNVNQIFLSFGKNKIVN